LKQQLQPMKDLKSQMDAIVKGVTDPKTGLLTRFNCKFMRKEIDHTYDAMCKQLVPHMGNMSLVLMCVAILLVVG